MSANRTDLALETREMPTVGGDGPDGAEVTAEENEGRGITVTWVRIVNGNFTQMNFMSGLLFEKGLPTGLFAMHFFPETYYSLPYFYSCFSQIFPCH